MEEDLKGIYDGDKELKGFVIDFYTKMFEKILDLAEDFFLMSGIEKSTEIYKNMRSKILRIGNDSIRDIEEKFKDYTITTKIIRKDVIDFGQNKIKDKEDLNGSKG